MHIEAPRGVWIQTVLLIVCNNSICLVYVYRMGWKIKGMTTLFCEHKQTQKGNIEINVLNENKKRSICYKCSKLFVHAIRQQQSTLIKVFFSE